MLWFGREVYFSWFMSIGDFLSVCSIVYRMFHNLQRLNIDLHGGFRAQVWQLLYYSILSVYQSTFEVEIYGAAVLGVDAPLFFAIQLVTQLFWLGSGMLGQRRWPPNTRPVF